MNLMRVLWLSTAGCLWMGWIAQGFCDPPTLQLLSVSPPHSIQLSLHGQDSNTYTVEISTNLTSWQPLLSLTPTNGVAVFSPDGAATETALFFRAALGPNQTNQPLQLRVWSEFSAPSVVTPEGGIAELLTPDLRHITLTIPSNCVVQPKAFTMTLVTNIDGLPFSQGSFGAVVLEPEGLSFSGAALLEIDLPPGIDSTHVLSFGADNDGSFFHLVPDHLVTNRVTIPITELATYGSALATSSELDAFLHSSVLRKEVRPRGIGDPCPPDPNFTYFDASQIPQSCTECFPDLVSRALSVRGQLRSFLWCEILTPLAQDIAVARQQQFLGSNDDLSATVAKTVARICPVYEAKIEPLWAEASENCALGEVLFGFMMGTEGRLQLLGVSTYDCSFGVTTNLDKLCISSHECLREIDDCCQSGHKGIARYQEGLQVLRPFQYFGDRSCFPLQDQEPEILALVKDCISNAWYGTMKISINGKYHNTTRYQLGSNTYDDKTTDMRVDMSLDNASAYYSLEDPVTATTEGGLIVRAVGTGSVKLHHTVSQDQLSYCVGGTPIHWRQVMQSDTFGITNFEGMVLTNDLSQASGTYTFVFILQTNQTYQLLTSDGDLILGTDAISSTITRSELCKGEPKTDIQEPSKFHSLFVIPKIFSGQRLVFPMSGGNSVSGSFDNIDTNLFAPTVVAEHVEWNFYRNTNAAPPGP